MRKRLGVVATVLAVALLVGTSKVEPSGASTAGNKSYLVVFSGDYAVDGSYAVNGGYAVSATTPSPPGTRSAATTPPRTTTRSLS